MAIAQAAQEKCGKLVSYATGKWIKRGAGLLFRQFIFREFPGAALGRSKSLNGLPAYWGGGRRRLKSGDESSVFIRSAARAAFHGFSSGGWRVFRRSPGLSGGFLASS